MKEVSLPNQCSSFTEEWQKSSHFGNNVLSLVCSSTAMSSAQKGSGNGASVGLGIALAALVVVGTIAALMAVSFYRKLRMLR